MTPHQVRDTLVSTIVDTAALLDVEGWAEDSAPGVKSCDAGGADGAKYSYGYGAPQPPGDHVKDVQTVAEHWKSLGMTVKVVTDPDPAVFAAGGPIQNISFSTNPGNYYISGTSLCAPGDALQLLKEESEP